MKLDAKIPLSKNMEKNPKEKMIGDYVFEKTLGQGTFGKVKQGYHVFTK